MYSNSVDFRRAGFLAQSLAVLYCNNVLVERPKRMTLAFLATLGQAPEAITFALDKLIQQGNRYERIVILHTDVERSAIQQAYQRLMPILQTDYAIQVESITLSFSDGRPLVDIQDEASANAYFRSLGKALLHYKQTHGTLHLLVSGGRKAMSIYAMTAASILFNPLRDRVLTVLSDERVLAQGGQWHIPPSDWGHVQMVNLPFVPFRRIPNDDPSRYFEGEPLPNPHAQFLRTLSKEEHALAEMLLRYPYDTSEQLAQRLNKSAKTVTNQFNTIYAKMQTYYGNVLPDATKRIALLDVLREGV